MRVKETVGAFGLRRDGQRCAGGGYFVDAHRRAGRGQALCLFSGLCHAVLPEGDLWEIGGAQQVGIGQDHGAVDGVFELADIARPVIGFKKRGRRRIEPRQTLAGLGGKAGQEMLG